MCARWVAYSFIISAPERERERIHLCMVTAAPVWSFGWSGGFASCARQALSFLRTRPDFFCDSGR